MDQRNQASIGGVFRADIASAAILGYVVQEPPDGRTTSTSPGLAQALDAAYHLSRGKTVFFGMADTIMQPNNVFKLASEAAGPEDDVILVLFETDHPEKFGMVSLNAEQKVIMIVDKPATTHLTHMWGCIIWRLRFTEFRHDCVTQQGISDFALNHECGHRPRHVLPRVSSRAGHVNTDLGTL